MYIPHLGGHMSSLIPGAHRGEASVDFILIGNGPVLDRLRRMPSERPIICVFALVACTDTDLERLRDGVQQSTRWAEALDLVQRWRHRSWSGQPVFRATALRDDGAPQPKVNDIARATASGVFRRFGWPVSMTAYDIEVCAIWLATGKVLVGLPLSPGWHACERVAKGGFFPVESIPGASSGIGSNGESRGSPSQPVLRPSVCHGLLLWSGVTSSDLVCDPMCGVASLPVEALARFKLPYVLGGDNGRTAIREAGRRRSRSAALAAGRCVTTSLTIGQGCVLQMKLRLQAAPALDVARWDVRRLPLRSNCLDGILVDVPWGNRGKAEPELLRETFMELERVLCVGGIAVVLLLRAAACAFQERGLPGVQLRPEGLLEVCVGGWPVAAIRLRKLDGASASPAGGGASSTTASRPSLALRVVASQSCFTVVVDDTLAELSLAELLVAAFPSVVESLSNARRAIRHKRVCLAEAPEAVLWWRSVVPKGLRVVLRPHLARMQPTEALVALHATDPLRVMWETDEWLAVVKPAGMGVMRGRRSLANALLALQAHRSRVPGAHDSGDRHTVSVPWTVAYDGPAKLAGVWLAAKTPTAAVALLDGALQVELSWTAVFKGSPAASMLSSCVGLTGPVVRRIGRSVRYESISEVTFGTGCEGVGAWRDIAASAGFPVVGDRPHCDGPAICVWVNAVRLPSATRGEEELGSHASISAATPDRFARLFEREERVCTFRDQGQMTSEYAVRMQAVAGLLPVPSLPRTRDQGVVDDGLRDAQEEEEEDEEDVEEEDHGDHADSAIEDHVEDASSGDEGGHGHGHG